MSDAPAHYPYQAAVDAYGNGGFRFADMSHKGSILALPGGMFAWGACDATTLAPHDVAPILSEAGRIGHCLLGTGSSLVLPPPAIVALLAEAGIALEPMSTGSAARTYNILLAERRPVAAALIAVD